MKHELYHLHLKLNKKPISKVTSIYGTPLGAGGIPERSKLPNSLLSLAISLSP
jgi:hypothetical protein